MNGRKLVAKPAGMAAGAVGGKAFKSLWRRADGGREVPEAGDQARSWRAVLLAAALQGAVFALIHAVVERVTARPQAPADTAADGTAGKDGERHSRRSRRSQH